MGKEWCLANPWPNLPVGGRPAGGCTSAVTCGRFQLFRFDMELAELGTALLPGVGSVRLSVEVLTSTRTFLRFSERFAISGEV